MTEQVRLSCFTKQTLLVIPCSFTEYKCKNTVGYYVCIYVEENKWEGTVTKK